jgi:DNA invertase Pin-like site-specific DNA recombinase
VKQGEHGVSLQEQKSEIERYAQQRGMAISEWFEERETAAKIGRKLFTELMQRLRKGHAAGVIIHKIDRSARNLRDWVDIGQLTDDGIEVHFTRESLDLQSSSGRLSADVQAVVAANYIRNLREETIKGFYGRLKQGVYPLPAPLGYLDAGRGKPKIVDPERGHLVTEAFRLYATGEYSQHSLMREMWRKGLRTRKNQRVSKNTLAGILSNPFYSGLIRIKKSNQVFAGAHRPLVSKQVFDAVQTVSRRRGPKLVRRHEFLFARLIHCLQCGRCLIAERQKGRVYYRCHTRTCQRVSFREEKLDSEMRQVLKGLALHPRETKTLDKYVYEKRQSSAEAQQVGLRAIEIRLNEVKDRLGRLTDIYIDGNLDTESFNERKKTLLGERLDYERRIQELSEDDGAALKRLDEFVELVKRAPTQYENGLLAEKREMVQNTMSNRVAHGKTLGFTLKMALSEVAARPSGQYGDHPRCNSRFWKEWVDRLCDPEIPRRVDGESDSGNPSREY